MVPDLINPTFIVLLHVVLVLWLSWVYFRRYQMTRPPIGVFNLGDIALMLTGIVLIPYLYLYLPRWLVVGLLLLGAGSILYFTFEPILNRRWTIWLVTGVLVFAELGMVGRYGRQSPAFFFVNNGVQSLSVIGVTVLWAQSGMKARDVAVLGLGLTVYDFLFTTQLSLMADLFARLTTLPFAPIIAWPLANSHLWLGIGLGDLLLAAVFPLVMRKAFGRNGIPLPHDWRANRRRIFQ